MASENITLDSRSRRLPARLRAYVRGDAILQTVLGTAIGAIAGFFAGIINYLTQMAHEIAFHLPAHQRLSSATHLAPARALLVPILGGLAVGGITWFFTRINPRNTIDPIEANALYGGKMSLRDSLVMIGQILLSNACGASVGLEAGYTQMGGAIASHAGQFFKLRRHDLRVMVGCGAAGAIASAFAAPLTGAFYAFELVIGNYALTTLAPVIAASITAVFVSEKFFSAGTHLAAIMPPKTLFLSLPPVMALGGIAALLGIAIMRAVTACESLFRKIPVPASLRPASGGLLVGMLALLTPAIMSGGHGAMRDIFFATPGLTLLIVLFILKAGASVISLGAGFRGGLFFASLFLGSLLGKIYAILLAFLPLPSDALLADPVYALIGMAAMATSIIGAPLTMSFLALEATLNLPLSSVVLAACVASSLTTRRLFGYSFATWRFHLRGEAITSAADIGWIQQFTVGRMMRRDVPCVKLDDTIAQVCETYPLGATSRLIAVDAQNHYAGIVWPADAHAARAKGGNVASIVHHIETVLYPALTIKDAFDYFATAQCDVLAVIDTAQNPKVIGVLSEYYALRRYAEELDKRRRELAGGILDRGYINANFPYRRYR
jgi:CIC family chloride channel protein